MTMLADRVALVTGASSGIGAGLAAMLAAEGARVALAARRSEELERVAAGIRRAGGVALPVVTDLAASGHPLASCPQIFRSVPTAGCLRRRQLSQQRT